MGWSWEASHHMFYGARIVRVKGETFEYGPNEYVDELGSWLEYNGFLPGAIEFDEMQQRLVLNYEAHQAGLNRGPNFQPWCGSCGHQSDCFYAGGTGCGPTTQWGDAWCEVNMLGTACNRD